MVLFTGVCANLGLDVLRPHPSRLAGYHAICFTELPSGRLASESGTEMFFVTIDMVVGPRGGKLVCEDHEDINGVYRRQINGEYDFVKQGW